LIARASLLVAALAACSSSPPPVARSATCVSIEMAPVGPALTDPQHPCREWLASVYGRVAPLGLGYSATHLSLSTARGTSLVATCQHCAGGLEAIRHPEGPQPPRAIEIGPAARLEGDRALSPLQRDHQRTFSATCSTPPLSSRRRAPTSPGACRETTSPSPRRAGRCTGSPAISA
jgi:hypothetical protein